MNLKYIKINKSYGKILINEALKNRQPKPSSRPLRDFFKGPDLSLQGGILGTYEKIRSIE